jgi:hypothetical protein
MPAVNAPQRCRPVSVLFQYRLSSAAYAFKKQALLAAAVDHPPPGVIEEFWWAGEPFERSKRRDDGDNQRD